MSPVGTSTCQICGRSHGTDVECGAGKDPRIGTVIDGKYELVRLLGQGGMGSVYEARHTGLERRFAIKFLLPEFVANHEVLRRFSNEAKAAGRLEHPNVGAVTDLGRAPDGSPFLVLEFLRGMDCARLLKKSGPLTVSRACNIVYQACLGLDAAHMAGIVHRDVKPENLFVTDAGDGTDLVKVLDFGIAKLRLPDASAVTGSGASMGTFFYMSPEQIRDAGKVDQRTDIWALGVVLYELLTGKKPFDGADALQVIYRIVNENPEPVDRLRDGLPGQLVKIIQRAMNKSHDERFESAPALADAIAPFTGRQSVRPAQQVDPFDATVAASTPLQRSTTSHAGIATISKIVRQAGAGKLQKKRRLVVSWLFGAVAAAVAGTAAFALSKRDPPAPAFPTAGAVVVSSVDTSIVTLASSPVGSSETDRNVGLGGATARTVFEHARSNTTSKRIDGNPSGTEGLPAAEKTQAVPVPTPSTPTSAPPRPSQARPVSPNPTVSIDTHNPFSSH